MKSEEEEEAYTTLYSRLVPFRYDEDKLNREFSFGKWITTVAIWMPAYTVYSAMIAPLFDSPNCDLGKTTVSPELRRQIGVVTSMVSECSYCSAHSAGLGDAFNGSHLKSNSEVRILPNELNNKERTALRLVVASVKIPSQTTSQMRRDVVALYGQDGLEKIIGVVGWLSFMSTFTDTLGCELEVEAEEHARYALEKAGWDPTHTTPRKRTHLRRKAQDERIGMSCLSLTCGANKATDFLDLALNVIKATLSDSRMLQKFPSKPEDIAH
ncbi:hypothetical protein HK096_009458, partial [Nowakowskiella sp. JEL0078]